MVLRKLRLFIARMKQDGLIFPLKEVHPCEMRQDETFNNRVPLEIEVFDSDEAKNNNQPDAVLRGILCQSIKQNAPTLICAMGQSQNVEAARHYIPTEIFHSFNIVLVNYRGYGSVNGTDKQKARGSSGEPSARALERDILTVYDHIQQKFGYSNFYAVGVSLGSAVVTYLSKHRKLSGQLLVVPFDTMIKQAYDFLVDYHKLTDITVDDVSNVLDHDFDSIQNMKNNHTPTYIIRAGADSYIKPERTLSLMKHIKNLRSELVIEHADHNFGGENPDILNALRFGVGAMLTNFLNDALVKNNS